jgi:two-component system, NtrC family, response regulator AtoC
MVMLTDFSMWKGRCAVMTQAIESREFPPMVKKSPALRVLVVDDEPLIRWSLSEALSDCGHHVTETGDARTARGAVQNASRTFDVVLLDYRLPDSEDLSLLAWIRALAPEARVILMTAFGSAEVVRGAVDLGAYRVISKPFEIHEMTDLVAEAGAA